MAAQSHSRRFLHRAVRVLGSQQPCSAGTATGTEWSHGQTPEPVVQADPRVQDDHKNTALGIVVSFRKFQSDRLQIAQQLVAAARRLAGPPLFNIPDSGGHTPVLLAATFGDARMLQFMIDQPESDVAARNNAGTLRTPVPPPSKHAPLCLIPQSLRCASVGPWAAPHVLVQCCCPSRMHA